MTTAGVLAEDSVAADCAAIRLPSDVAPVIGCWFPTNAGGEPDNFKPFIDGIAQHTAINLVTSSIRIGNRYMADPDVIEAHRKAAAYARERGIALVPELGPWSSFCKAYPDQPLQLIRLIKKPLADQGEVTVETTYRGEWSHLQGWPFTIGPARVARVYFYVRGPQGIDPKTVEDISAKIKVLQEKHGLIQIAIPCSEATRGREAAVLFEIDWQWPDPFSPDLPKNMKEHLGKYADAGLAGACFDEWGMPAFRPVNEQWTSPHWEAAYAKRTGGRDLLRDMLLMVEGEAGREGERYGAVNQYMEMFWRQLAWNQEDFYRATKEVFGPDAFVGTHDTVFPYPDSREFERNGLNWWTATRDFGQTDEITPYSCRTSLAKKFGKPVWFNQWYSSNIEPYQKKIWSYALTGGRMNFHIIYPGSGGDFKRGGKLLLRTNLLRGDSRIRLLNKISDAPLDCPVAVIFGHHNVMNWAGGSYENIGTKLTDAFWRAGFYADLIPSTEITNGSLRVDENGDIWYGKQRYSAVILHEPQFENASTAEFFRKADKGDAILRRVGEWTRDFNAQPIDGAALLPKRMLSASDVDTCAAEVIEKLNAAGIEAMTPSRGDFPKWSGKGETSVDMPASGHSRLTDGTVLLVAGETDPTGGPIQQTIDVNGHQVTFDAIGVAAVRLGKDGRLDTMAAGGLKRFVVGNTVIELPERADLALWKDEKGQWQGVLQDVEGEVPEALQKFTRNWLRLKVPKPLP